MKRFFPSYCAALAAGLAAVFAGNLQAGVTVNARSPAFADVAAAILLAKNGDTVVVPVGEATWSQPLVIAKSITLQGQTVVSGGFSEWMAAMSKVSPLVYTPPVTRRTVIHGSISLAPGGDGLYRVTGFTFIPPTSTNIINVKAGVPNFRVDHNEFADAINEHVWAWNEKGLVDHNVSNNSSQIFFHHKPLSWGGTNSSYLGDGSWAADADAGDAQGNAAKAENKVYVEDNFFRPKATRGFTDGESGARFVARYNIMFSSACENHGAEAAYNRSGRLHEIYHNQYYSREGISKGAATYWRGGTGFIFANTLSRTGAKDSYGSIGNVVDYRLNSSGSWGIADGKNGWDLNSTGQLMRALDQPGAGKDADPLHGNHSSMTPRFPQQAKEPFYVWLNRLNGTKTDLSNAGYTFIKENLDYYNESPSNDGKTGVGVGPLANRPATATDGVGYWATDQQQLFVRRQGTWVTYYRPYVYPHPLATGAPEAPTNLSIVP
jgi:hypothetical protein